MGQITIDTWLGSFLKNVCQQNPQIKTVVEIGTWDGMGSTNCIIQGLAASGKSDMKFVSLESHPSMYHSAIQAWEGRLPEWVSFVHGRILETEEMDSSELTSVERGWFEKDVRGMNSCPNVMDAIPAQIDLLLLDGGEFSTQIEFQKLKDRSKLIVLDDTNSRKCKAIRSHVLASPNKYHLVFDAPEVRVGVMGFEVLSDL